MVCFAHKTQIMRIKRKLTRHLSKYFLLIANQSTDRKTPKLFFFLFFENHFLFPFLYFTFATLNISN